MYTRCPSCRAEISFEPPANLETLPDGYKHRIKCPSCGVTIGVKINKIETQTAELAQQAPTYPQPQTDFEPVYNDVASETSDKKEKKEKHSGVGRNVTMMVMSLLFIVLSALGCLVNSKVIKNDLFGISALDGISGWITLFKDSNSFKTAFDNSALLGIAKLVPMVLLLFAFANFLVALISACGKKYSRAYNVVSSVIIGLLAIALMFTGLLTGQEEGSASLSISEYFSKLANGGYLVFVNAALGLVQIVLGLCFIKSLDRKVEV